MYEVELKVRADHDRVRDALADLGAEQVEHVTQVDTYYDAPHRDFAETDEALRIREERADGTTTRVTYKGPLVEAASKTREEYETAVAEADAMRGILDGLGFEPAATVEKDRDVYRVDVEWLDLPADRNPAVDAYTITLDDVAGLGEFVEVEREAPEESIEAVREGAAQVLRDLGLDPEAQIRTSYLGLLLDSQ